MFDVLPVPGRRTFVRSLLRHLRLSAAMTSSRQTLKLLRDFECRNVTFMDPDGSWPIVWSRARGVHVWDAEGKKYLDLTAAFGVAAAGHANPRVIRAGQKQMELLLHAMGDVHPHALKAQMDEMNSLNIGVPEFFDLKQPWLHSPG